MNKNKGRYLYISLALAVLAGFIVACDPPDSLPDTPVITHKVTFHLGDTASGGTGTATGALVVQVNDGATNLAAPVGLTPPTGKVLDGWFAVDKADAAIPTGAKAYVLTDAVTKDIILKAKWADPSTIRRTVTFVLGDAASGGVGTIADSSLLVVEVAYGAITLAAPANITPPTGKRFDGWYVVTNEGTAIAADATAYLLNTAVTTDLILKAKWVVERTVTFVAEDGSTISTAIVGEGTHASAPETAPTKANFVFGGWFAVATANTPVAVGATPYNFAMETVSGDIFLKAKWLVERTVTFVLDNGSTNSTAIVGDGTQASAIKLPADPTKANFVFGGWVSVVDPGSTVEAGFPLYDFAMETVTHDITLKAKWVAAHTVTFLAETGPTPLKTVPVATGTSAKEPAADSDIVKAAIAAKVGTGSDKYRVDGWTKYTTDTDTSGGTAYYFTPPVTADIFLRPVYTRVFTVTYDIDGGTGTAPAAVDVEVGESIPTAPTPDPTKPNLAFDDWYVRGADGSLGAVFTFGADDSGTLVNGDITLKAGWITPPSCVSGPLKPADKVTLQALIKEKLKADPAGRNLADIDTSCITNMAGLFRSPDDDSGEGDTAFNGDIGEWKVSQVTNMSNMFYGDTVFNQDLSKWDVSKVTNMSHMFYGANAFNQDLNNWNVSTVANMSYMFGYAIVFNGNISNWTVSAVTDMNNMFWHAEAFNQDLNWDVSKVRDMSYMFSNAEAFKGNINNWKVSQVTNMSYMFAYTQVFNGDISAWKVPAVTDMSSMFEGTPTFNRDLSKWDVSKVTNMNQMFKDAGVFNGNISNWSVSKVTDMRRMFYRAATFNQDLSKWDVHSVAAYGEAFTRSGIANEPSKQPNFTPTP